MMGKYKFDMPQTFQIWSDCLKMENAQSHRAAFEILCLFDS